MELPLAEVEVLELDKCHWLEDNTEPVGKVLSSSTSVGALDW
ncbi:hypothetical protein [Methylomusa anaerophila]|nr:hypothetical protein [Methylomusa anaerophila]